MDRQRAVLEPALLFLVMFLPGYLAQAQGASATPQVSGAMIDAILLGVPQCLLVLYVLSLQPYVPSERFGLVPLELRDAIRILVAWLGCLAIYGVLAAAAAAAPGLAGLRGGLRWHLASPLDIPLAVGGSLATGYREELYFRAYLLVRLAQAGLPPWIAVSVSAVLFALGHLYEGPLGVATALCIGVWFCLIFLRTRRLHVVALAHGLWNAAALALTLVLGSLPPG